MKPTIDSPAKILKTQLLRRVFTSTRAIVQIWEREITRTTREAKHLVSICKCTL